MKNIKTEWGFCSHYISLTVFAKLVSFLTHIYITHIRLVQVGKRRETYFNNINVTYIMQLLLLCQCLLFKSLDGKLMLLKLKATLFEETNLYPPW